MPTAELGVSDKDFIPLSRKTSFNSDSVRPVESNPPWMSSSDNFWPSVSGFYLSNGFLVLVIFFLPAEIIQKNSIFSAPVRICTPLIFLIWNVSIFCCWPQFLASSRYYPDTNGAFLSHGTEHLESPWLRSGPTVPILSKQQKLMQNFMQQENPILFEFRYQRSTLTLRDTIQNFRQFIFSLISKLIN